jgi:hypothetical protein
MSGTSTNLLDDLVSIFTLSSSGAPIASAAAPTPAIDALRGFGGVFAGDGGALDSVESTRGSPGVVLERRTTL